MQRLCWEPRSWGGRHRGGARAARRMAGRRRGACTRVSPSIIFTPSLTVFYRHIGLFWDINKKRKEKNGSLLQICKEFQLWKWAAQPIVEVWVHWQCEAKPAQTGNTESVLLPQGDVQVAIHLFVVLKFSSTACTLRLYFDPGRSDCWTEVEQRLLPLCSEVCLWKNSKQLPPVVYSPYVVSKCKPLGAGLLPYLV